jgi:tRNA modification GTPase
LREAADEIEIEGVRRALARAAAADLKIALFDATAWPALDPSTRDLVDADTMVVVNKSDLAAVPAPASVAGRSALTVSMKTGAGVERLMQALEAEVADRIGGSDSAPVLTRARHRQALEECHAALTRAASGAVPELIAEDLRLALRALGRITGRVDVEDILDAIFREFCIGK